MKKYINYSYAKKMYSFVKKTILVSFSIIASTITLTGTSLGTAYASSQTPQADNADVTIKNLGKTDLKKVNGFENLGKFKSWEAFSMISSDEVVCWVSSEGALDKTNPNVKPNSKPSSLMLSIRLENKERDEFSYHSQYSLAEQAKITLTIDKVVGFKLSPQGHWAWLKSSIDESRFVLAAQKGTSVVLSGTTTKDKPFSESYSLSGFTAAYKMAFDACQKELDKKTTSH